MAESFLVRFEHRIDFAGEENRLVCQVYCLEWLFDRNLRKREHNVALSLVMSKNNRTMKKVGGGRDDLYASLL